MTVVLAEGRKSRRMMVGPNPASYLIYNVVTSGETDPDTAIRDFADVNLPATYDDKPLLSYEVEPVDAINATDEMWTIEATYANPRGGQILPVGGSASSFDTTGGSRRVLQSLKTVSSYSLPGSTPPNYQGAIGVSESGIEGVEIVDPVFSFQEIRIKAAATVDAAFKAVIFGMTGRVNSESWNGYEDGEVLFMGATGVQRSEDEWEIVYRFIASQNATGLAVGEISGISKAGHDYLWALYSDEIDGASNTLVKVPRAVFVEQVYKRGAFSALGLI